MKNERHNLILKLISEYEIDTQETLQAFLCERGFTVTQATVSRDIKELSLVKAMASNGGYKYTLPKSITDKNPKTGVFSLFADAVVSVDYALNTVVVKCHVGMANAVCSKLDTAKLSEIVGTIAGDDTIFILMRTESHARELCEDLKKLL